MKNLFLLALLLSPAFLFPQVQEGKKINIAIMPFKGVSKEQGDALAGLFSARLAQLKRYRPLTRSDGAVAKIMDEFKFQSSGLADEGSLVQIGEALAAEYILEGIVAPMGGGYLLSVNVINIASFETVSGDAVQIRRLDQAYALVPGMAAKIDAVIQGTDAPILNTATAPERLDALMKKYLPLKDVAGKYLIPPSRPMAIKRKGVDARENSEPSLLAIAAREGWIDLAETLLALGAALNIPDIENRLMVPLHYAALGGSADAVSVLLKNKAEKEAKDKAGWTALHYAAINNKADVMKALISGGLAVNALDENGRTPLIWAAYKGNLEAVTVLLEAKASAGIKDKGGDRAIDYAKKQINSAASYKEIINILKKAK